MISPGTMGGARRTDNNAGRRDRRCRRRFHVRVRRVCRGGFAAFSPTATRQSSPVDAIFGRQQQQQLSTAAESQPQPTSSSSSSSDAKIRPRQQQVQSATRVPQQLQQNRKMNDTASAGTSDANTSYYVFEATKVIFYLLLLILLNIFMSYVHGKYFRKEKKQLITVCNEKYASFESRFQSFENCSVELNQYICSLCEAGFYFTGNGGNDGVACFSCNIHLQKWEDCDNPWVQHARWSKDCSYLLLCKGQLFVSRICGIYDLDYVKNDQLFLRDHGNAMRLNKVFSAENSNNRSDENDDAPRSHDHQE